MLGIFLAISSAFCFSCMNLIDKYVVDKKLQNFWGFMPNAGIVNTLIGLILFIFYPLQINLGSLYAAIAGIALGIGAFLYFYMLQYDDASSIIGLIYIYPVLVTLGGVIILGEKITPIFVIGLFLLVAGALIGLFRFHKIKHVLLILLISLISLSVVDDILSKLAMDFVSFMHATAVFCFCLGTTQLVALFKKESRETVSKHFHIIPYFVLSDIFTTLGLILSFAALTLIPVSIFSALSILQVFFLLFLEKIYAIYNPKVKIMLRHKYLSVTFIATGFVLVVLPG